MGMKKSLVFSLLVFAFGLTVPAFTQSSTSTSGTLYKANVQASYYADKYNGSITANGETFNMYDFTAAHKTLPFNTLVKVTNLENGKSVIVRINDRGPSERGREIDVSKAAAIELGMIGTGFAKVSLEILQTPVAQNQAIPVETVAEESVASAGASASNAPVASAIEPVSTQQTSSIQPVQNAKAEEKPTAWDIQVGAYSNRANADTLVSRLVESGFTNIAYQEAGQMTRVLIYDVADGNVDNVTAQLNAFGFNHYVVRKHQEPATTKGSSSGTANGTVRTDSATASASTTTNLYGR